MEKGKVEVLDYKREIGREVNVDLLKGFKNGILRGNNDVTSGDWMLMRLKNITAL